MTNPTLSSTSNLWIPGNKEGTKQMSTILTAQTSVTIDHAMCDLIKNFSVGNHMTTPPCIKRPHPGFEPSPAQAASSMRLPRFIFYFTLGRNSFDQPYEQHHGRD